MFQLWKNPLNILWFGYLFERLSCTRDISEALSAVVRLPWLPTAFFVFQSDTDTNKIDKVRHWTDRIHELTFHQVH